MKLGMALDYARGFRESADAVADFERAGLDVVWVAEAYGFDSPSQMGYLAAKTERINIGSYILPIYSRTPALIAQTAAGIDALSEGRFILGIGSSGPQVVEGWHGVPYDEPIRRTREVVEICRKVWRRDLLTNDGIYALPLPAGLGTGLGKPLKLLTRPVRASIPIWVAALGPKNVELAAEVADGWLPLFYVPEWADAVWKEPLERGARARSVELGALEIAASVPVAIGDGLEDLREQSRPRLALYVGGMGAKGHNFYNTLVRRYGFEAEAELVQDLYLSGKKDEAAAALPSELVEKTSLIGDAGYVRERIEAYRDSGVTVLNVSPLGSDPVHTIELLRAWMN